MVQPCLCWQLKARSGLVGKGGHRRVRDVNENDFLKPVSQAIDNYLLERDVIESHWVSRKSAKELRSSKET